jgi:hypothetical protein
MNIFNTQKKPNYKVLRDIDDDIQTILFLSKSDNPLSCQGIKFCEKLYELIYFEKSASNLTYIFDKNVSIKFYFRNTGPIIHIVNPKLKINIVKVWDKKYAKNYASLSWNEISKELEYINILSYENSKDR